MENTWIHGRQKKRKRLRQLRELPRAPRCPGISSETTEASAALQKRPLDTPTTDGAQNTPAQEQSEEQIGNGASLCGTKEQEAHIPLGEQMEVLENVSGEDVDTEFSESLQEPDLKEGVASARSPGAVDHFLFKCLLNVMHEESDVAIEMHWVEGQNKDLMNQLCTYLKNTLLRSVTKS